MMTPSFKSVFNAISGWLNTHKTVLTLLTITFSWAGTIVVSQFVMADEFKAYVVENEQFKAEALKALNEKYIIDQRQDAQIELQQVTEDIEFYLSDPNLEQNTRAQLRLDSLQKRREHLVNKING